MGTYDQEWGEWQIPKSFIKLKFLSFSSLENNPHYINLFSFSFVFLENLFIAFSSFSHTSQPFSRQQQKPETSPPLTLTHPLFVRVWKGVYWDFILKCIYNIIIIIWFLWVNDGNVSALWILQASLFSHVWPLSVFSSLHTYTHSLSHDYVQRNEVNILKKTSETCWMDMTWRYCVRGVWFCSLMSRVHTRNHRIR